jgi:hypothetical protein
MTRVAPIPVPLARARRRQIEEIILDLQYQSMILIREQPNNLDARRVAERLDKAVFHAGAAAAILHRHIPPRYQPGKIDWNSFIRSLKTK